MSDWNAKVIEEFRANDGKVGGFFEDKSVLILHATGARSGLERITPLVYLKEGTASSSSRRRVAATRTPTGTTTSRRTQRSASRSAPVPSSATAVEIVGEERDAIYARQAAAIENFAEYQAATERTIPVIELVFD